jgi:hypothetical protein
MPREFIKNYSKNYNTLNISLTEMSHFSAVKLLKKRPYSF